MSNAALLQSIQKTVAYFDLFDYPLTASELWRFLWQPPLVTDDIFYTELTEALADSHLETHQGFYFLPGRSSITVSRQDKIVPSDRWLERAKKSARLLSCIPFLKSIFVCNSVGAERATVRSDIDLLIVAAPGYTWWVRFWSNVLLRLTGERTYQTNTAGKICLSFFVDTDHLDRSAERIAEDDVHFAYWIVQMVPIYDPGNFFAAFLVANQWLKNYLPHIFESVTDVPSAAFSVDKAGFTIFERIIMTRLGAAINRWLMNKQMALVSQRLKKSVQQFPSDIRLSPGVIKLHEHDTRRAWRDRWLKHSAQYN